MPEGTLRAILKDAVAAVQDVLDSICHTLSRVSACLARHDAQIGAKRFVSRNNADSRRQHSGVTNQVRGHAVDDVDRESQLFSAWSPIAI